MQNSGVQAYVILALCGVCAALAGVLVQMWRRQAGFVAAESPDLVQFRNERRDWQTGLASRQAFGDELSRRLQGHLAAALLIIDIDDFAAINAMHGYRAGDQLLIAVADRLRNLLPEANQVARLGSDEFGVLLDAAYGADAIEAAILQILRLLQAPVMAGPALVTGHFSIGAALTPLHATEPDGLMRAAHAALAEAKLAGGKMWRIFDPEQEAARLQRYRLRDELRLAIPRGEIVPYYQPIIDLATGRVTGLEVLARWQHPSLGLLDARHFIAEADEAGLCGLLTESLLRRVIVEARDWPSWLYFAFNASSGQLRELIALMRAPPTWPEGPLEPRRLEIEVTESALIDDIAVAREVMSVLHERGTRIVLDNFGIGLSNFFHLRELPFDRIKIDGSFVRDILQDPRADACVRAMLALGHVMGVDMVAKGIDSAEVARYVRQLGCRFGQGFYFSGVVPGEAVKALVHAPKLSMVD